MTYYIKDMNANRVIVILNSNNGKNALKQFLRNHCMNTGMYEIHKRLNTWILSSSYGSYFMAIKKEDYNHE